MSDNPAVAEPDAAVTTEETETFDADYVKKLRDEAAKYRIQAKENADAAAKLVEIEESQKTEAQKLADKLAALEKENAAFKQREQIAEWSREITKDSHIPADVLRGNSEEELKAHFEQLLSLVPEPTPQQTVIPGTAETNSLALNGDGIEDALKRALGIN